MRTLRAFPGELEAIPCQKGREKILSGSSLAINAPISLFADTAVPFRRRLRICPRWRFYGHLKRTLKHWRAFRYVSFLDECVGDLSPAKLGDAGNFIPDFRVSQNGFIAPKSLLWNQILCWNRFGWRFAVDQVRLTSKNFDCLKHSPPSRIPLGRRAESLSKTGSKIQEESEMNVRSSILGRGYEFLTRVANSLQSPFLLAVRLWSQHRTPISAIGPVQFITPREEE